MNPGESTDHDKPAIGTESPMPIAIYLDNCSLHRPLDDRTQPRINLEAEAVLSILTLCEGSKLRLVASDVLEYEANRNPDAEKRVLVGEVLASARQIVSMSDSVKQRANVLVTRGFKALDAMHVACAEAASVDYFCTCDDRLLSRIRLQSDVHIKAVTPLELAEELL
ncbi:MAG TPA: PIN domain-containing protein [Chthonomonadaceae bacterium]|nr:PIN domain-containing protein [Chthonomonadaceae bacterium]